MSRVLTVYLSSTDLADHVAVVTLEDRSSLRHFGTNWTLQSLLQLTDRHLAGKFHVAGIKS